MLILCFDRTIKTSVQAESKNMGICSFESKIKSQVGETWWEVESFL